MRSLIKISVLILIFLILISAGMTGCGKNEARVAFFVYDENDTFISEMMQSMSEMVPDEIRTEIRYAGNSQVKQNQQIVELTDTNIEIFVINAVDRMACGSIAEKCITNDINVIFFNREPLGDVMQNRNIYYVGSDADNEGKKQAQMAAELFGEFKGSSYDKNKDGIIQVAVLKGEQGHQDAEKRTDNCISMLRALGYEVEVLGIEAGNWSRDSGYESAKKLYTNYGNTIELLFCNNDDMAVGAIRFLQEAGIFKEKARVFKDDEKKYDQPFLLISVDGTAVGLDAINRGLMYGTVLNDSAKQADAVMTLVEYILDKRDMSDFPYEILNAGYIFVDGDIITMENLAEYL